MEAFLDELFEVGVSADEHDGNTVDLVAVCLLLFEELLHHETAEDCEVDGQDNS